MKSWLHKIEVLVDKIIPFVLVILLGIIVIEFGFHDLAEKYRLVIEILDWFIVSVFIVDLIFKYLRIRNIPKFLRASWIDILAIFPFFLVFRLLGGFIGAFEAGETLTRGQKIVHVGVEIEKEFGVAIKEGEKFAKEISRTEKFGIFLRPISRLLRIFKAIDPEVRKETERQAIEVVKQAEKNSKLVIKNAEKGEKIIEKQTKAIFKETGKVPRHIKAAIFYEKPKIMKYVNAKIIGKK